MVRADIGVSGVLFTCETETGHEDFVQINSLYGLGETIVQGRAIPDEFLVHKPTFREGYRRVLSRTLGTKALTLGYSDDALQRRVGKNAPSSNNDDQRRLPLEEGKCSLGYEAEYGKYGTDAATMTAMMAIQECESTLICSPTPDSKQACFSLAPSEVMILADDALEIENRFKCFMDIEFAKDGVDEFIYILQARPETINVKRKRLRSLGQALTYTVDATAAARAKVLSSCGMAVGDKVAVGPVKICHNSSDALSLASCTPGDILVTNMTSPETVP